jgi:2-polyprenyl-3-methyl-5-hydroxy-6-metoxy-1,4-benzoquinol methylase
VTDKIFGTPGAWSYSRCSNAGCGMAWINPMPTKAEIHKAYATYYTHYSADLPSRIINKISNIAFDLFYRLVGLARERDNSRLRYADKPERGRLLDVGSGNGIYLQQMRALGWQVEGVETDPKACAISRDKYGLVIHAGELEGQALPADSYDAITLNHVIEHVHDPVALLKECRRIVKPGGKVIVTTPNVGSFGHQRFSANWRGLEAPRHLQLFSLPGLLSCAEQAGFDHNEIKTSIIGCDYILGFSRILARHSAPPSSTATSLWQKIGDKLQTFPLVLREYRLWKANPESGEEIVLIAQKH